MIAVRVAPSFFDIDARESPIASDYRSVWEGARNQVLDRLQGTAQDWAPLVASALQEIRSECSASDWDGEGADAVSDFALHRAELVATALNRFVSAGIPAPELTPSNDGEITLSWIRSSKRLFSISVGAHQNMNYAGRLKEGFEPHDVARFDTENPTPLLRMASFISQLYGGKAT